MAYIIWDYYELQYCKRKYQILVPKDISQLWIVYYPDADKMWEMDIDFFGNRKGLEAVRNACTALLAKDNIIVYFPCKKNTHFLMSNYFFSDQTDFKRHEFVDLVFMKPNSIKISDWKKIRKHIFKMKSGQWGYDFQFGYNDTHKKEKYKYRKETPKVISCFDTVFFNALSFLYTDLSYKVEEFLRPELEDNFYEDIKKGDPLRREAYLWLYPVKNYYNFETGIFFWDDDIYQKASG